MANPIQNFLHYLQGWTKGIVYLNASAAKNFLTFPSPQNHLLRRFHSERAPVNLCSSSSGLVLFLDSSSFYWICNPKTFLHDRINGCRKIPKRTTDVIPHVFNTPSVLSLDNSDPSHGIFYISCPIDTGDFVYKIDTYCSDFGWRWSSEEIHLSAPIISYTAISCGTMAHWLTEEGDLVVYDPVTRTARPPLALPQWDQVLFAQLGVVMGNRLGVVIVRAGSIALYLLSQDNSAWGTEAWGFLFVNCCINTYGWNGVASSFNSPGQIDCRHHPKPLRFESSRIMQVLMVIDGKLFMWEDNTSQPGSSILLPVLDSQVPEDCIVKSVPVTQVDLLI